MLSPRFGDLNHDSNDDFVIDLNYGSNDSLEEIKDDAQ